MYTDEPAPAGRQLVGVEAVIDKDLASALLARDLRADALLIVTDVDAVYDGWGTPEQRAIRRATPEALAATEFAAGSMGPKVKAACSFVEETGGLAAIGSIVDTPALLRGDAGTVVTRDADGLELAEVAEMSEHELSSQPGPEQKSRFTLPSAYTILFALIVLAAIATWIIPAGTYDLNDAGEPIPGTYHEVDAKPSRILVDSLTAPINGLYGIEDATGNINYYNSGTLFGAIDIALFILVIGGFLGVTMKTGRDPGGHRQPRPADGRPGAADDPGADVRLRARGHDLRDGGGEPGVLRARDHRPDRRRLRRAHGRRGRPARLRDRRARLDDQPVRDRDRIRDRRTSRSATGSSGGS